MENKTHSFHVTIMVDGISYRGNETLATIDEIKHQEEVVRGIQNGLVESIVIYCRSSIHHFTKGALKKSVITLTTKEL